MVNTVVAGLRAEPNDLEMAHSFPRDRLGAKIIWKLFKAHTDTNPEAGENLFHR